MAPLPPRRRRPRPLPDAPIGSLLGRSEALARAWLIALVEERPLQEAGRIHLPELIAAGPALCEAMLRALADEAQLRRLQSGGEGGRLAAVAKHVAASESPEAVSHAVECLRSVLWWALCEEFTDASPDQLFHLGDRLALVSELVRSAALRDPTRVRGTPAVGRADEGEEDIWQQLLSAAVARAQREGAPLALVLVELEDTDRLVAAAGPEKAAEVLGRFEAAVWEAATGQGEVLSDAGRAWVIAPGVDRPGANALAGRVTAAVAAAEPWAGAPLRAAAGVAVYGEDGADAGSLVAAAELAKFTAQASGGG